VIDSLILKHSESSQRLNLGSARLTTGIVPLL
jgi:hypothetical protein